MMKKRMLALIFAVTVSLSAVACGSGDVSTSAPESSTQTEEAEEPAEAAVPEETEAEEIDAMAAAQENAESITSMDATMSMEMVMEATDKDGQQQRMESLMVMDMVTFNDPFKMKMEMSITGQDGEETQETSMGVYAETADDGTTMMYLTDGESWQSGAANVRELEQYNAITNMVDTVAVGYAFTLEGMEAVDGANAYKYAHKLTAEETKQVLMSSGVLDNVAAAVQGADGREHDGDGGKREGRNGRRSRGNGPEFSDDKNEHDILQFQQCYRFYHSGRSKSKLKK